MLRKLRLLLLYRKVMQQIKRDDRKYHLYEKGNFIISVWYIHPKNRWVVYVTELNTPSHIDELFTIKQTDKIWENVFKPFWNNCVISATSLF